MCDNCVRHCVRCPGTYDAVGCDQVTCCCMMPMTFGQSGTQYSVSGPMKGACRGLPSASFLIPRPTAPSISFTLAGQQHTVTRNETTGVISDVNVPVRQCSAVLTNTARAGASDASAEVAVGVYADAACSQRLAASTQAKGACLASRVGDGEVHLRATCVGDSWVAQGFESAPCTPGQAAYAASGSGPNACSKAADGIFFRVRCDGDSLSGAAHTAPAMVVLALATIAALIARI